MKAKELFSATVWGGWGLGGNKMTICYVSKSRTRNDHSSLLPLFLDSPVRPEPEPYSTHWIIMSPETSESLLNNI